MNIQLTNDEKMKIIYECLCTGLPYFRDYGLELNYDQNQYDNARDELKTKSTDIVCFEDILLEIIKTTSNGITFKDIEGSEPDTILNMALINDDDKWNKIPLNRINQFITENYDAEDADVLMQYLFFGELIYG